MNSYQRLKRKYEAKVQSLTKDIVTLVENKDLEAVMETHTRWKMNLNMEKMIWKGTYK